MYVCVCVCVHVSVCLYVSHTFLCLSKRPGGAERSGPTAALQRDLVALTHSPLPRSFFPPGLGMVALSPVENGVVSRNDAGEAKMQIPRQYPRAL